MSSNSAVLRVPGDDLPGTRRGVLSELRALDRMYRSVQARRFELMAHLDQWWGDLDEDGNYLLPGAERLVPAGQDGTPGIAESTSLELATALHVRAETVEVELSVASDCRHRLPHAWDAVMRLDLTVWQAQKLVTATRDLDHDAALRVDEGLRDLYGRIPFRRLHDLAKGLVLEAMPAEQAEAQYRAARDARRVEFNDLDDLLGHVEAVLDAPDQRDLASQVGRIAAILKQAGLVDTDQGLRARALGILARPAQAVQLLPAAILDLNLTDPTILGTDQLPLSAAAPTADAVTVGDMASGFAPTDEDHPVRAGTVAGGCDLAGRLGHTCGTITVNPDRLLPTAQLVIHTTDTAVRTGEGIARVENIGAAKAEWLHDLLGHRRVVVKPVVDANTICPADSYEVPARMREAVERRTPFEAFPFSTRRSRRCDLDHTDPYRWDDTPGQTRPDNLGPLSRRAHRAKTHGRWRLEQPAPGVFIWRSPEGFVYLTTPTMSLELHDPTRGLHGGADEEMMVNDPPADPRRLIRAEWQNQVIHLSRHDLAAQHDRAG